MVYDLSALTDPEVCRKVTDKYPDYFTFPVEEWFHDKRNYALMYGKNVGLAEYKKEGVYWVHFCFDQARGKEAIQLAKQMIKKLYEDTGLSIIIGPVEETNKAAKVIVRRVGFKSLGKENTDRGLFEFFFLTKNEIKEF